MGSALELLLFAFLAFPQESRAGSSFPAASAFSAAPDVERFLVPPRTNHYRHRLNTPER